MVADIDYVGLSHTKEGFIRLIGGIVLLHVVLISTNKTSRFLPEAE
jgi:hypothetical protein